MRMHKAGVVRPAAFGTYDNFNIDVDGLNGHLVAGIDLIYDTLLAPSLDEVSAEYGLLADAVTYPMDFSSVTYRYREAKWHDGQRVTGDDVIFSFDWATILRELTRKHVTLSILWDEYIAHNPAWAATS